MFMHNASDFFIIKLPLSGKLVDTCNGLLEINGKLFNKVTLFSVLSVDEVYVILKG